MKAKWKLSSSVSLASSGKKLISTNVRNYPTLGDQNFTSLRWSIINNSHTAVPHIFLGRGGSVGTLEDLQEETEEEKQNREDQRLAGIMLGHLDITVAEFSKSYLQLFCSCVINRNRILECSWVCAVNVDPNVHFNAQKSTNIAPCSLHLYFLSL